MGKLYRLDANRETKWHDSGDVVRSRKSHLEKTLTSDPTHDPPIVPAEYGGKWLAWSADGLQIFGVGDSPEQAEVDAQRESSAEATPVILEWVPPAEEAFLGAVG